jgi:hypothetical protein
MNYRVALLRRADIDAAKSTAGLPDDLDAVP